MPHKCGGAWQKSGTVTESRWLSSHQRRRRRNPVRTCLRHARRKGYEVGDDESVEGQGWFAGGPVRPLLVEVHDLEKEKFRGILDGWKPFLD